jgi:hypothetical protein
MGEAMADLPNVVNILDHQKRILHAKGQSQVLEKYREARAEVLRKLYDEMEPEMMRICTWEDPVDGRKNKHELWEVEEGISPFDLPDLEEKMPNFEDFLN